MLTEGVPNSSVGIESACNAGDPRSIPGSCGSAGKEPPAMWETWAQSMGWGDPLEKGKATYFSILA